MSRLHLSLLLHDKSAIVEGPNARAASLVVEVVCRSQPELQQDHKICDQESENP